MSYHLALLYTVVEFDDSVVQFPHMPSPIHLTFDRASYIAKVVNMEKASYKVQIWDTAGQEQVEFLIYYINIFYN